MPDDSDERFALKDISGTTRVWSEFAGKPLAINFWATWCGPCRMEIPVLKKLYAEYQPKGLEIIGISVDRDQRKVLPYVQQMGMPWVVLYTNREVLQEFKMGQGIPYTIFIDAEGNETGRVIGAQPEGVFRRELAKILKKIVVADISPVQLQLNRENAHKLGFSEAIERWVECDICDLAPHFEEAEFDAVVCYGGPLSYVFGERERAVRELSRVTKPGGILLFGVMSLWGTAHHALPGILQVDPALNNEILATGDLDPAKVTVATHFCHLFRATELASFLERAGLLVEVLSASDCLSATWAELLETIQQDRDRWQYLLEMEIEACREPGCVDMGTHLIAVCKNIWMHDMRKRKYHLVEDSVLDVALETEDTDSEMEEKLSALYVHHFNQLSRDCRELLRMHFKGVSLTDIMKKFGYSSEHYTSDRKYRCKQSLLNRIRKDPKYKEIIHGS